MPKALIVGATSGLGMALAQIYRERGWVVHSVQRKDASHTTDSPWICDLSHPSAVSSLASDPSKMAGFDLGIFSAGTSEAGYVDALNPESFRRCLEVNFLAPIALFNAMARASPPCRRFVFILSGAAEFLVPGLAPYALSKRALRDYLTFRDLESSFPDCRILTVWPGPLATNFDAKTRLHGGYRLPKAAKVRSPEEVARRILEAEASGKNRLDLSPMARRLGQFQAAVPHAARWLMRCHPALRSLLRHT